MRTHLRESMLALLLIGILATGCDTGTKKASENSITFDSISVEKTYHLLDNPDNPQLQSRDQVRLSPEIFG